MELTPFLHRDHSNPLYIQLYEYVKKEIEAGRLTADAKLPSIRRFAGHLQVSKNTVEIAYQQLIAEGYVESRPRSGLRVLPLAGMRDQLPTTDKSPTSIEQEGGEPCRYDFQYGTIDREHFPMKLWKKCLHEALAAESEQVLLYGPRQGSMELRTEIAHYLFQSRGVACTPEQIVICSGTQSAVSMICQGMELAGQLVAMENPGYEGVRSAFFNHGCVIHPVPLEPDGVRIADLPSNGARLAYVTPSHQFPCGMILPIQKRLQLLQWASDTDSYILEDDYDSEYRYQGQPIPPLKALDGNERVIYMGTFSKSFLPALRISYLVLPTSLAGLMEAKFPYYSQSASPLLQQAVYLFMREGHYERHVRKMRKVYQIKHRVFLRELERCLGNHARVIGEKSGLHILLEVDHPNGMDLLAEAARRGVRVYRPAASWLVPEHCPPNLLLLGFAGLSEQALCEGVRLLQEAWFPRNRVSMK